MDSLVEWLHRRHPDDQSLDRLPVSWMLAALAVVLPVSLLLA
jgi:hypothetical protein